MANTLDDVLNEVQEESTVSDSLIALLEGIKKQLDDALASGGGTLDQAKVDQIFAKVSANKQKLQDVVLANTPNEEPGTPSDTEA